MSVKHFTALALWKLLLFITAPKYANANVSSASIRPSPSVNASTALLKPTPTVPKLDACEHYQVLSDPTRALSYQSYTSKCDYHLYGWYRFMGQAGNRMQSRCPYAYGPRFRCGSYYQGWLLEAHPSAYEGEVSRTVCFTRTPYNYNCQCDYKKMIKVKRCGSFYVYWLDGTPTCSARYCGAKDPMSSSYCSSNYMRIILNGLYYNASQYETITLRDPGCAASYITRDIVLGSVPNYCGSTRQETKGHIIYTNEVIMKAKQNADMVTRAHDEVIQFSCKYRRDSTVSGSSFLPVSRISGNESSIGSFSFQLEMFRNKLYNSKYYSYPVQVQLRDYLYFQVRANTQDSGLVLLIDQCYSTNTMNRRQSSEYMLINSGCPVDDTVQFHSAAGQRQRQRFSFQAFRYLNNQSAVFIHCLVFLCQNTSRDSRCTSGCPGNNVNNPRFRRDLSNAVGSEKESSKYYLLEVGPVVLDKGKSYNEKQGDENSNTTLMTTVIVLVVGVVGLVIAVTLLLMKMKRARVSPERESNDLGIDNASDEKENANDEEVNRKRGETVMSCKP